MALISKLLPTAVLVPDNSSGSLPNMLIQTFCVDTTRESLTVLPLDVHRKDGRDTTTICGVLFRVPFAAKVVRWIRARQALTAHDLLTNA